MCVACVEENAFSPQTCVTKHKITRSSERLSAAALEQCRLALAHADAERREPVPAVPAAQLVQERDDQTGAAHTEGGPHGDRAAVHVHLLVVEAELADDGEALRRERLVQLHQVEVANGQ